MTRPANEIDRDQREAARARRISYAMNDRESYRTLQAYAEELERRIALAPR